MKRQLIAVLILFVLIPASCGQIVNKKISTPNVANAKTPSLKGGPEAGKRVTDFKQVTKLASRFSNILFYSGPAFPRQVALTFDDGPDIYFTTRILDILKRNHIKATFFIVGSRAKAHPEIVRRIVAEGHVIGNHTWNHPDIIKLSPGKVWLQISKTDQVLTNITGFHTFLFRPPYGAATHENIEAVAAMGYKIIDWSVDTRDWAGTPVPQILGFVRKELRPGGIILQHCAGGRGEDLTNTVNALPKIIASLRAQRYTFVTVPELLKINNWKSK